MTALWLSRAAKARWEELVVKAIWGFAVLVAFVPFVGIFFGRPLLGIILGFLSVGSLYLLPRWRARDALGLVMVMCICLSAATTIYYSVMKEKRDYLGFTREALREAKGSEIIVLAPDEIFEGTLPMITGRTYRCVERPTDIRQEGLYIWADKNGIFIRKVKRIAKVEVVLEKKIGSRSARLALITPIH